MRMHKIGEEVVVKIADKVASYTTIGHTVYINWKHRWKRVQVDYTKYDGTPGCYFECFKF